MDQTPVAPGLDELVDRLLDDPRYSTGELPPLRSVSTDEAIMVLRDVYGGSEDADRYLPGIAERMNRSIACHRGCPGKCCESLVLISTPEAAMIAEVLDRPERRADRERFLTRVVPWLERCGERAQRASDALTGGDVAIYVKLMHEHGLAHSMCPFNTNDSCDIHDARPLPCRQAWVLDTWKHCRASVAPDVPKASLLTSRAHEDLYTRANRVVAGLQNAMGRGVQRLPLPAAVLQILLRKRAK